MKSWLQAHKWIAVGLAMAVIVMSVLLVWVETSRAPAPPDNGSTPVGVETTIEGEALCLPHKNTDGPQTLECAFGIKLDDGTYYGLRDTDEQYLKVSELTTGERYQIKGTLKLESNDKYQSVGVFTINEATKID